MSVNILDITQMLFSVIIANLKMELYTFYS